METINIKGKEYVMVNERVKEFRSNELYKWYSLETIIIECTDKRVVMQALVKDKDWRVIAMWTAFEEKDSPASSRVLVWSPAFAASNRVLNWDIVV